VSVKDNPLDATWLGRYREGFALSMCVVSQISTNNANTLLLIFYTVVINRHWYIYMDTKHAGIPSNYHANSQFRTISTYPVVLYG